MKTEVFNVRLDANLIQAFKRHRDKRNLKSNELFREMFVAYAMKREILRQEKLTKEN